ncbi:Uncharacterised protein [Streptococcus pneumoniae]|nr:Uncharacterised protein [Streptococcus pneumoniae]
MRRSPGRRSERMRACQWSPAANTRPRVGDTTRHYARRGGWATAFPTGLVDNVWIRRRVVWIAWGPRWGQPLGHSWNPALTWDDAISRAVEEDSLPPFRARPPDLTSPPFVPSSHRLVHAYPHRRPHPPHLWTTPVDKVPGSGDGGVDSLCPRPAGGQCDGPIHRENSPAPRAMRPDPGSHSHFTSISVECGAPHVFCA